MKKLIALMGLGIGLIASYINGCATLDTKYSKQVDTKKIEQVVTKENQGVSVKPKIRSIDDVAKEYFPDIPGDPNSDIENYGIGVFCADDLTAAMPRAENWGRTDLMLKIATGVKSETVVEDRITVDDINKMGTRGRLRGSKANQWYQTGSFDPEKTEIAHNAYPWVKVEEGKGKQCAVAFVGFFDPRAKEASVENVTKAVEEYYSN